MEQITDLSVMVKKLLAETPQDKQDEVLNHFMSVYGSFPSCRNVKGDEYFKKMNEKLQYSYKKAKELN